MSANGRLTAKELTKVQGSLTLAKDTAARYLLLKTAAKKQLGRVISIALPAGAYRTYAVQDAMHVAGSAKGTKAQRVAWGLNPNSVVSIAPAGYSSHGFGTRVDIVGTAMDTAFLNLAAHYGFTREFGPADPNHFQDHGTYKLTVIKKAQAAVTSKQVVITIQAGDTLSEIAAEHRTSVAAILKLNTKIKNPNQIKIGQKVRVK